MNSSSRTSAQFYVNFERAVGYFRRCLLSIQGRQPVKHVIEWNGGPGLGKTSLVRKLMQERCIPEEMSWTSINFKEAKGNGRDYYSDPTLMILDMISDFSTSLNIDTTLLDQAIANYRAVRPSGTFIYNYLQLLRIDQPVNWLEAMNQVCAVFIEIVDTLGNVKHNIRPVIFFMDETESIEYELADWLEEHILSRLVLKDYCLIVWTGRRHWRWKRPEVRNQLVREDIGHFKPDDVEDYINLNHSSTAEILLSWVDAVHRLSGGHGYSVSLAVHVLDHWLRENQVEKLPYSYEAMECTLLSALRRDFVLDYAFEGLNESVSEALELLALLRSLDTNLVNHILVKNQDLEIDNPYEYSISLLDQLKKTDLLVWRNTSYAVGDDIRHVLQAYYHKCEPEIYTQVHEKAVEAYSEMLGKAQDNLNLLMIEKLFHLAAVSQIRDSVDLEGEFRRQLNDYPFRISDRDFLGHTLEQLKAMLENDNELNDLTNGQAKENFAMQVQALIERLTPLGSV